MGYKFYPAFALLVCFILCTLIAIFCVAVRKNKGKSFFNKKLISSYVLSLYISFIASYFLFPIALVHREHFRYPDIDIIFYPFANKFLIFILLILIPIGILLGILCNKRSKFRVLLYSILIPSFLYFINYFLILYEIKEYDTINLYELLISIVAIFLGYILHNIKSKITNIDNAVDKSINNADKNVKSFLLYLFKEYF